METPGASRRGRAAWRSLPAIAFACVVVLFATWTAWRGYRAEREQAEARLGALASLRAVQVNAWMSRLTTLASFVSTSNLFAEQLELWRQGDADAGRRLLDRLVEFRRANDADTVVVVEANGNVLGREHPADRVLSGEAAAALQVALASGKPVHTDIYERPGADVPLRLDVVVPLLRTGPQPTGAIVLRIDPRRTLFPLLLDWPVPSASGESLLWSRAGGQLRNVSDLRGRPGSVGQVVEPIDTSLLAPAVYLRGSTPRGHTFRARDYRGAAVIAMVEPVPDSDWLLVSKIDRDEVDAPARRLAAWVAAVAALVLLAGFLFRRASVQRELFAQGQRERESQQQVEAGLARDRDVLEQLVEQRTAELREANGSLATQQKLVRTIADAIPGLVGYFDTELRCRFANASYQQWFGKNPTGLIGEEMKDVLGPGLYEANLPYIRAVLLGETQTFQRKIVRGDGSVGYTLASFLPDIEDGVVRGACVVVSDITDLKLAELKLIELNAQLGLRADDAESANRSKSAFLANMSHEIRTPMNAIIGLTHLLSRDAKDVSQRDRLAKIDGAAKHLLQIINDILDLSKVEAGKMVLEEVEFSLDSLVDRSFEMVGGRAREKGLERVLDTDHAPTHLRGDPTRLAQAVINLLANAVKFTERGWVRLAVTLLREERNRVELRFEVQDTGIGVPLERQARLFAPFEQADASMTRRHGGTGLGLALTRHLSNLMGGEAAMSSDPGGGSRFWFTAWLGKASEAGERARPMALAGLRALLVDDLAEARAALAEQLTMQGLAVEAFADGRSAADHLRDELAAGRVYDVLLVDWRMTPFDGVQTLQLMRGEAGDGLPPSILVTAFDDAEMWRRSREARFDAVLVKPITPSALHDVLARILRGRPGAAAQATAASGSSELALRAGHAGQRVLLAEDNPVNQDVACELLRIAGLAVETADNGTHAVELALSRSYDLVLMDVQMPGMDGIEATRELRSRLGPGLPIVAMTANAFADDRAACLASGMNDHVAKPVDPEALYATLLRWLPLRRDGSPASPAAAPVAGTSAPRDAAQAARLATLAGLDLARGLRMVGGQLPVLLRALAAFARLYRDGDPVLGQAASPEATAAWRGACHSIRGASASLGLVAVERDALALESLLAGPFDGADGATRARGLNEALTTTARRLGAELDGP